MIKAHKEVHARLREHHPEAVKKAKRIFSFKYPKLFLLIFFIALSYYLFSTPLISDLVNSFNHLGHFGVFISGAMTAFGFTAPFGIGLLSKINPENILLATIIAGIGAMVTDIFIFHTIKFSFTDELKKLEKTKAIKEIEKIVKENKHIKVAHYLLYVIAGLIIVTPIPDEIGVSMLAGLTTINPIKFAVISFCLHTSAIFFLFSIV